MLSLGHTLILPLIVENQSLLLHLDMILLYWAIFLHSRCFCMRINYTLYLLYLSSYVYLTLQWYVSTVTVPKVVLLVAHLTNPNMKSLMTLTSLLLVETLSDSDYIMVYVFNVNCTDGIVPATLSQRLKIENCIVNNLDVTSVDINVKFFYQEFDR